ncbi:MAG: AidA/PixA family protein [Bacteroidota bacterium]
MKSENKKGKTINVLIAVDGETLYNQIQDGSLLAGTADNPTSIGNYGTTDVYLSMVTQHSNVTNNPQGGHGQGESELSIICNIGDSIQWSVITFDANTGQTPYLYGGNFKCLAPAGAAAGIKTPLKYLTTEVVNYFPPTNNPTGTPIAATNTIARAIGLITAPGQTLQYSLAFALVNNSNGTIIGYFSWDPFIVINPLIQ